MSVRLYSEQYTAPTPKRLSVLGLPVHLLQDYAEWLVNRLEKQLSTHVVTLNAEMAMQAEQNPELASLIDQAELVVPDGAGIVFYAWLHGIKVQRCPGIELAETLLDQASQLERRRIFFYGGAPGVAEQTAQQWQKRAPGLQVLGAQHGYLTPAEQGELQHTLKTLQPDIILVGLGVPRQEFWIAEHRSLCPNSIWIGVGGSFDIWSGTKSRAPEWLRNNHLEWTYRLYQEPWRWRRMLALPKFAWKSFIYRLSGKAFSQRSFP